METIKRLIYDHTKITVYDTEEVKVSAYSDFTKKFLVQRKTIIRFIIFFLILRIIGNIVTTALYYNDIKHTIDLNFDRSAYTKLMIFDICFIIITVINTVILFFAQYYWYQFKKSIIFTHILGFIIIYLQMVLLFLPYTTIFSEATVEGKLFNAKIINIDELLKWIHECINQYLYNQLIAMGIDIIQLIRWINIGINIHNNGAYYLFLKQLFFNILGYLLPNIMIIQAVITRTNFFVDTYDIKQLKFVAKILSAVYIPIITFVFAVAYQFFTFTFLDYLNYITFVLPNGMQVSNLVIMFWLFYITSICLPLIPTKHVSKHIIDNIFTCILIAVLIVICKYLHIDFIDFVLSGVVNYMLLSQIIADFMMHQILKNNNKENLNILQFQCDQNYRQIPLLDQYETELN